MSFMSVSTLQLLLLEYACLKDANRKFGSEIGVTVVCRVVLGMWGGRVDVFTLPSVSEQHVQTQGQSNGDQHSMCVIQRGVCFLEPS